MDAHLLQFHAILSQCATRVEDVLNIVLPAQDALLGAPIRHAALSGGKRLRAFLAIESASLFRVPPGQALRTAAAVECVHAYSLVHDDLPAMDDDATRRGKPTIHVKWDEATAILTGDALLTLAFDILSAPQGGIDPRVQVRLISRLARCAGVDGMVGGQVLDITAEHSMARLDFDDIAMLQGLKTGALISWAAESGAILGRQDTAPLQSYAKDLGLAFQIRDDILDVEGDPETVGKSLRKDEAAGKATFVSLLGLEGARQRAQELADSACSHLSPYGSAAANLRLAAEFAIGRPG
ncbi:MAG: polyprenyl synthetase family protein [Pseudomonadota bacterium]